MGDRTPGFPPQGEETPALGARVRASQSQKTAAAALARPAPGTFSRRAAAKPGGAPVRPPIAVPRALCRCENAHHRPDADDKRASAEIGPDKQMMGHSLGAN